MNVIKRNKLEITKLRVCTVKKVASKLDNKTIAASVERAIQDLNFNDQKINLDNALRLALSWEDLELTKLFIDLGGDINARDEWGTTSLHLAAMYQDISFIIYLVSQGSAVDVMDAGHNTPLHRLIDHQTTTATVEIFLDFHPDVNAYNRVGEISLSNAVRENNLEVAELLINRGSDVNNRNIEVGTTPLHLACRSLNKKMIKLLLRNGANIDALDYKERTPLMCALKSTGDNLEKVNKLDEVLLYLLKHRASVNILTTESKHVFTYATEESSQKIILKHLARFKVQKLPIHSALLDSISRSDKFNNYFAACTEELLVAKKSTLISSSWITYFDLLVGNKEQLKNYAGNKDLIEDFQRRRKIRNRKFRIYGALMEEKVKKGIFRQKLCYDGANVFRWCFPGLYPSDLVMTKILSYFSNSDLRKMTS